MATKSISLVRGRRLRLTRLNAGGNPVYGEDSTAVSKGFITVNFTANTTESDEINVTNAAGETCVYEPAETSLTGYGVEIEFCEVDPELFSIVTGQPVVRNTAGDVIGFDIDTRTKLEGQGFAMELWAGSGQTSGGATTAEYGYLLLPFLKGGIVGDFTLENGAVTFTLTGANTRDGNKWGVGPYQDIMLSGGVPGPMTSPISPTTALRLIITDVAPPAAYTGARPMLDPSLQPLTSITATRYASDTTGMTAAFDVTPAATGPVWYEFGDGTWDYVAAPGSTSHLYKKAGTYKVRASQSGDWVEKTVTVPIS